MNIYKDNDVVGNISVTKDDKYIVINDKKNNTLYEINEYKKALDRIEKWSGNKEKDRILIELKANSEKLTTLIKLEKLKSRKKNSNENQLSLF